MQTFSNQKVTLKQIAETLGLGITTVSDILLRGKTNYRASTIDNVKQTAKKLGYRPNRLAQGMRQGRTSTIGILLTSNLIDPFFAELLDSIESRLTDLGMTVILSISDNDIDHNRRAIEFFESHRVDGLIVGPIYKPGGIDSVYQRYKTSLPTVMILAENDAPYDNVNIERGSDSVVGRIAINYLLEMGHSKIGYFMCPPQVQDRSGFQPYRAFARALRPRNLFNEEWIWRGSPPVAEEAYQRMSDILMKRKRGTSFPTALYCHNDHCAIGALAALRDKGFNVPEDISLMGTDNIQISPYLSPGLTTIDLHPSQLATEAVRLLAERLAEPELSNRHTFVEPTLIVRDSVQRIGASLVRSNKSNKKIVSQKRRL